MWATGPLCTHLGKLAVIVFGALIFHRFGAVHDGGQLLRGIGLTLSEHGPQYRRVPAHQHARQFLAAQRRHTRVAGDHGVVATAEHGLRHGRGGGHL